MNELDHEKLDVYVAWADEVVERTSATVSRWSIPLAITRSGTGTGTKCLGAMRVQMVRRIAGTGTI
jgi:hypothetical protein